MQLRIYAPWWDKTDPREPGQMTCCSGERGAGRGGDDRSPLEEPGCKVAGSGAGPEPPAGLPGLGAAERNLLPPAVGRAEASLLEV